jgi:hypothetical protein
LPFAGAADVQDTVAIKTAAIAMEDRERRTP